MTDIGIALQGTAKRRRREHVVRGWMFACAAFSLIITLAIVFSLVGEAWTFISQVDLNTLWGGRWAPRFGEHDLRTLFVGSAMVTGIAMLIAAPMGLGAAIYLSEYAAPRVRKTLKPVLEVLAGIPSVVLGFFALQWISPNVVQRLSDAELFNLVAAGIGVGLLTIPLVASISEDALRAVPNDLREASAGLGARKWRTTVTVVVPAAISGLVAALIVAISRAIGETMVVAIAAGSAQQINFTLSPLEPGGTMTSAMIAQARGTDAAVGEALTFQSLFFVGLLLFLFTLGLNLLANRFVRRVRNAY
ncbi:MAG: phosphate ABC transporter permease subunit PstC [Acidimicrobiales bacterium]